MHVYQKQCIQSHSMLTDIPVLPVKVDRVTVALAPFKTRTPVNAEAPSNLLSLMLVLNIDKVVPASLNWKTSLIPVKPETVVLVTMLAAPPLANEKLYGYYNMCKLLVSHTHYFKVGLVVKASSFPLTSISPPLKKTLSNMVTPPLEVAIAL